jgi:hypothetical protein
MKAKHLFFISFSSLLLHACQPDIIRIENDVKRDGSIERSISIRTTDSSESALEIFGISTDEGWQKQVLALRDSSDIDSNELWDRDKSRFEIEYSRFFPSSGEANRIMDTGSDTVFQIHTSFRKRFRFFYTFYDYQDTYRPINRFRAPNPEQYLSEEDFAFLDSLPGRNTPLDSNQEISLKHIQDKKVNDFVTSATLRTNRDILVDEIRKAGFGDEWSNDLEDMCNRLQLGNKLESREPWDPALMLELADSIGIPLSPRL